MGNLTKTQQETVRRFLETQGLTFDPLKTELLDHLVSELEERVAGGETFESTWNELKQEIPKNHLKQIETETMEVLNKRFNYANAFTYFSLGLLALSSFFKFMHWPGAGSLLIGFTVTLSLTLLYGAFKSIVVFKEYQGRSLIALITMLIIGLHMGFLFKILHLPGANEIRFFSVGSLTLVFIGLSVYFYNSTKTLRDHLVIHLISTNQRLIQNVIVLSVITGLLLYGLSLGEYPFLSVIFFLFTIVLGGLYLFSLSWTFYAQSESKRDKVILLVLSSGILVIFMLPSLGDYTSVPFRYVSGYTSLILLNAMLFYYYAKVNREGSKWSSICVFLTVFGLYALLKMGAGLQLFDYGLKELFLLSEFKVGFLILLLVAAVNHYRSKAFFALVMVLIADHMIPML